MSDRSRRGVLVAGAALGLGSLHRIGDDVLRGAGKPESEDGAIAVRPVSGESSMAPSAGHVLAPPGLVSAWGLAAGQQLRLRRSANEVAVFTIERARGATETDRVWLSEDGLARLGTRAGFDATVSSPVPDGDRTPPEAARDGEYVETLRDRAGRRLVVAAPHGGNIEPHTDEQAERIVDRRPSSTAWIGRGWRPGGGAFDRWHVPSTEIHPASFPALGSIADRGFEHAVSFHGFGGDGVLIGGAAPWRLKRDVRSALADAVGDVLDVRLATDGPYVGSDQANVVNWLTENGRSGIQLEQSLTARREHWRSIADAVAGVFD